jgi:hypothetical protein
MGQRPFDAGFDRKVFLSPSNNDLIEEELPFKRLRVVVDFVNVTITMRTTVEEHALLTPSGQ